MNNIILNIVFLALSLGAGAGAILLLLKNTNLIDIEKSKEKAKEILDSVQEEANTLLQESNEQVTRRRDSLKNDVERRESHIKTVEASLQELEDSLNKREDKTRQINLSLTTEKEFLQSAENAIQNIEEESFKKLSSITGTTAEQLKEDIINGYVTELIQNNEEQLAHIEDTLKENANKIAKKALITIMQRLSSPTSVETRVVQIPVPKDHIKGKILGKNGENILMLESLIDVDVVFNDLPNTISISAFNLVNRRIAQKAIEKLINIREEINPKTIKIYVEKAEKETDEELYAIGKKAIEVMGIKIDNKELIRIIGRLQYRTSYGQNIMKHSMEVAWVSTMLGGELGLDIETCKIGGFLHDLGKAIDQNPDVQGAHDFLTKELMEKYNFTEQQIHAAWTHHDSEPPSTPEALIVQAADAVSACRPGARQESMDRYSEKIQALEETANAFEGVKNSYAISAGREIRVFVDSEKIEDSQMDDMAKNMALKIEENLSYPGTIKVNIIRKTQHIEIAK